MNGSGNGGGPGGGDMQGDASPPPAGDMAAASDRPSGTRSDPPAGSNNNPATPEAGTAGLAASEASTTLTTINIGDAMPDFSLTKLDGRVVTRAKLVGKPSVLLFGSYTAPNFRDRASLLQQVAQRYGSRVNWLIIYTREMHPMGKDEPERNRDDHIAIAQHASDADRTAAARNARDQLQLTMDIAPEKLDDAVSRRLNGFPNAALLFDASGKLVARQQWADAFALERAIDRELKRK
jgi:hypothetical protein